MKTTMAMSMMLTMAFLVSSHPMVLALIIVSQSLILCMLMHLMVMSPWASYVLFLIFLGGVMILFIYICSLTSSESMSNQIKYGFFKKMFITFMLILMTKINAINEMNLNFKTNMLSMFNKMFSFPLLMIMSYLILVLVILVKMINTNMGPLRTKKKSTT